MSTIVSSTPRRVDPVQAVSEVVPRRKVKVAPTTGDLDSVEVLRRELNWTRPDGGPCFSPSSDDALIAEFWSRQADELRNVGDAESKKLARTARLRNGLPAAKLKRLSKPAPSYHSEALRSSVLRTDWSPDAVQLAVDWSQPDMRCEMTLGREVVVSGLVPPQVAVDGRDRKTVGLWEEVCWLSEPLGDYLELELNLEGGVRLQRQFMLLRRDGLLLAADAVLLPGRGRVNCRLSLPFSPRSQVVPEEETRDVLLACGKRRCAVLPAALPEWRVERRHGELTSEDDRLTLEQQATDAAALYAPLCIAVDPKRVKQARTWRQLTIGENLQIQPADRAVGYRFQFGREHWFVYRSLTSRANRTVLGVNLQTNFLFARLKSDGEAETLIEIED